MLIDGSHETVVRRRMVLRKVISQVHGSGGPKNFEMALTDSVLNPIVAHVDGFRTSLLDSVVDDAACGAVVGD